MIGPLPAKAVSERYCSCGMPRFPAAEEAMPFTAEWHRSHLVRHLAAYPDSDANTRRNLESFIDDAARRELEGAAS